MLTPFAGKLQFFREPWEPSQQTGLGYNLTVLTRSIGACLLPLVLFAGFDAQTAPRRSGASPPGSDTSYVTCGEKILASRTVQGDIFTSPDGQHKAYAEVETTALNRERMPRSLHPLCVNNSRLYVRFAAGDFKLVFLQEPSDTDAGNSLRIVDWSADNRRLLVELAQWQYESPGLTRSPLVYDTEYRVFQQPDMGRLFDRYFGLECSLEVHVEGFSPEGKIIIETQPLLPEEEEVLGLSSCSKKTEDWLLTIAAEKLTPLPHTMKVEHYGKIERQPTK